jgi:hypothetical protein
MNRGTLRIRDLQSPRKDTPMKAIAFTLAALALMLATPSVRADDPASREIHYYTFTTAPELSEWTTYATSQDTCEHAATVTLIMAHDDGWPIDLIAPTALDMAHALPTDSPCRVTFGIR